MIHWHIFEHLIKKENGFIKEGDRVIELGEQFINIKQGWQHTKENPLLSPEFFPNIQVVSIDINPEYHALPLDLSKNISTKERPEQGDVLTDFGTLEHVKSLYWGLKNSFNLLKIGGNAMHVNPLSGAMWRITDFIILPLTSGKRL